MKLFKLDKWACDPFLEITPLAFHIINPASSFLCHLGQPAETFLDSGEAKHVEIMKNLCVNLGLLENDLWYFAVLSRATLNQIDYIIDPTSLKTIFLLFIATIHDWGS